MKVGGQSLHDRHLLFLGSHDRRHHFRSLVIHVEERPKASIFMLPEMAKDPFLCPRRQMLLDPLASSPWLEAKRVPTKVYAWIGFFL